MNWLMVIKDPSKPLAYTGKRNIKRCSSLKFKIERFTSFPSISKIKILLQGKGYFFLNIKKLINFINITFITFLYKDYN